ncbi:MerR family transcriptional regulator [Zhaonella formicivorans]|uniref:MerR family transcriptional regulator n=1 Tax=Zhaonella formicivorans TaxID=2528593 RepID=UPI0010D1098B|nr:MerR family transcriptional regulator [Zhaonella formicivorans]
MQADANYPMYTIGVVSQLLGVHQETLRIWERNGLVTPSRKNNQRLYSQNDLKRLQFIKTLLDDKGLNLAGVRQMIEFYPCWWKENCKGGRAKDSDAYVNPAKPCWKEEGTYCFTPLDKADFCQGCSFCAQCPEDCKFRKKE